MFTEIKKNIIIMSMLFVTMHLYGMQKPIDCPIITNGQKKNIENFFLELKNEGNINFNYQKKMLNTLQNDLFSGENNETYLVLSSFLRIITHTYTHEDIIIYDADDDNEDPIKAYVYLPIESTALTNLFLKEPVLLNSIIKYFNSVENKDTYTFESPIDNTTLKYAYYDKYTTLNGWTALLPKDAAKSRTPFFCMLVLFLVLGGISGSGLTIYFIK